MRKRRVPKKDTIQAALELVSSCESNGNTRMIYGPAVIVLYQEIRRVFAGELGLAVSQNYHRQKQLDKAVETIMKHPRRERGNHAD